MYPERKGIVKYRIATVLPCMKVVWEKIYYRLMHDLNFFMSNVCHGGFQVTWK